MSWRDGRSRPVVRKVYFTEQEWGKACALWRAGGGHRTFSAHARELLMWGSVRRVVIPADTDRLAHEVARCVCSIGSGPVEHLELVHVSGWF